MARMIRVLPAFIREIRVIRGQKCPGCGFAALGPFVVGPHLFQLNPGLSTASVLTIGRIYAQPLNDAQSLEGGELAGFHVKAPEFVAAEHQGRGHMGDVIGAEAMFRRVALREGAAGLIKSWVGSGVNSNPCPVGRSSSNCAAASAHFSGVMRTPPP
jgi:hypothetical protein